MLQLAYPWALLLVMAPFVIAWWWPAHTTRREAVRTPFFGQLADALGVEPSTGAVVLERTVGQRLLRPLVWLLLVTAVARPQWVEDPISRVESGRDLMVVVDLSGSMETRDFVGPDGAALDRLQAVKLVLDDFVDGREGDRLGLVLFGQAAFVQVPFTRDHDVFRQLLDEIQIGMAGPHTMMGDAIGVGIKAFEASEAEDRTVVLLTDGNDTGSRVPPEKAAEIAAEHGIVIYAIGVGDPAAAGDAPLDLDTLTSMTATTGGELFLATDREQLEQVSRQIDELEPIDLDSFSYRPRHELFQWPLGGALVVVLLFQLASMALAPRSRRSPGPGEGA